MVDSMLNKWDYSGVDEVCYSDDKCISYQKAADFLGDTVEDWGCGTAWAKRYFKNYRGIDGSPHKYVDEVVDLIHYTSDVDNILMRQVLECNEDWKVILENVIKSFKKKFCLIVFTPFADETHVAEVEPVIRLDHTPDERTISIIYFNKQDILNYFPASDGFLVSEESITTNQGYGRDWILYVERT